MYTHLLRRLLILTASAILLSTLSCSKSGTGGNSEKDENTPYVILDLGVASVSDSSVTLTWTATGDDADQGTASVYDIRYYSGMISAQNWASATQVSGEPSPKAAGQTETFEIRGLKEDSTYFFALKVADEANNWTNQSNCVSAICFEDIEVTFPDPAVDSIIRATIAKPAGAIHRSDLVSVVQLFANAANISSLEGLQYCVRLEVLFMSSNQISSLGPLTNLHMLGDVQLVDNDITDISPLYGSTNMQRLTLRQNSISDIAILAYHYRLQMLDLRTNSIADISPLVTNLALATGDTVYLEGNPLSVKSTDTLIPQLEARGLTVVH
jgi:Leucine-rich repeat (LRR) protein